MHEALLWARLQEELTRLVADFAGVAGVAVIDLYGGNEVLINANELFPTASSIKIHILTQLLLRAERGEVDLSTQVQIDPCDFVLGSGVLAYLDGPLVMTLLDIATLMIIVSDNTATNICLRVAGLEATNAMLEELGLSATKVHRKMMDDLAAVQEQENVSTPYELARMMEHLYRGQPESHVAAQVLAILRKLKDSTLTDALPDGTIFANKPGYVDGARCDVGIVDLARRPYVVAIMSKYALGSASEHSAALVEIARTIHQSFLALEKSNRYGRYVY